MSEAVTYLVDTNVLLRYLMNDHPEHGESARKLIAKAGRGEVALHVPFIAVVETIFTLQRFYQVAREDIGREFLKVLTAPGIKVAGPEWVLEAVEEYRTRNVSFGDACLAAEARTQGLPIASFDRGLDKFSGVERFEPK
jgi:predicted nucleic acid-binding protein